MYHIKGFPGDPTQETHQDSYFKCSICGCKEEHGKYDNLSGNLVCNDCLPTYEKECKEEECEWMEIPDVYLEYDDENPNDPNDD